MDTEPPFFNHLTTGRKIRLHKGEFLFHQGDNVGSIYIIRRGRLKLVRTTIDGNSVILQMAMAGDLLAEASLFVDAYHCTAIVDSKAVELSCYSRHELITICRQTATVAIQLAELFAHRILKLRAMLEIRNIRSAKQRIYAYFQMEAGAGHHVLLRMTYKDMAYQLGLAHETFYRAMRGLEAEKRIARKEGAIHLF